LGRRVRDRGLRALQADDGRWNGLARGVGAAGNEIPRALSRVRVDQDAVSRIAQRLPEARRAWRQQRLERASSDLFLAAIDLTVNAGERVWTLTLLVAGVWTRRAPGGVLAMEAAEGERWEAPHQLVRGVRLGCATIMEPSARW